MGIVLALGAIAATAVVIALMTSKSKPPTKPINGGEGNTTDKNKDEKDAGTEDGSRTGDKSLLDKGKEYLEGIEGGTIDVKIPDIIFEPDPDDEEDEPDPMPVVADPYSPYPIPTPGQYYQVVSGDTLWDLCKAAYGAGWKHEAFVDKTGVIGGENNWLKTTWNNKWKGGLFPKYSGWNTLWQSGYEFPVLYFPLSV